MNNYDKKHWEFIKKMFEEVVKIQSKQYKRISKLEEFMKMILEMMEEK